MGGLICGIVFLIGFLRGYGLLQMLKMSISLAAAAVPEALPAAATTTFALSIKKMRDHNVLIRDLEAVETLGAVRTICLDKTGTITWNRMTVLRAFTEMRRVHLRNGGFYEEERSVDPLSVQGLEMLMRVGVLCNETHINGKDGNGGYELSGSPTENALIHMAFHAGIDVPDLRKEHPLIEVNRRAENRLFMTTLHSVGKRGRFLAVKGSPAEVLAMCSHQMVNGESIELNEETRLNIEMQNERMAGEALRVLGMAYANNSNGGKIRENGDLTWLGLVGMADPIRDGVKEAIRSFHSAGIETVMITGDQSPTAYAVARDLELNQGKSLGILDSSELTGIDPETMVALAKRVYVYSRVSPAHKLRIVQALQAAGQGRRHDR